MSQHSFHGIAPFRLEPARSPDSASTDPAPGPQGARGDPAALAPGFQPALEPEASWMLRHLGMSPCGTSSAVSA